MATKRDVLAHLTRDELLAVVDRFTLAVPDRRAKEGLVEAAAASKKATLAEILPGYARDRLKELCRALGLDDGGKEKAPIVERIVGGGGGGKSEGAPSVRPSGVKASVARETFLYLGRSTASGSRPVPRPSDR